MSNKYNFSSNINYFIDFFDIFIGWNYFIMLILLYIIGQFLAKLIIIKFIRWCNTKYYYLRYIYIDVGAITPYYKVKKFSILEARIIDLISMFISGLILILFLVTFYQGKNGLSLLWEIIQYFCFNNIILKDDDILLVNNNTLNTYNYQYDYSEFHLNEYFNQVKKKNDEIDTHLKRLDYIVLTNLTISIILIIGYTFYIFFNNN